MAHSSSSNIHAPLEVAKGHHAGYIKAKFNLNWCKEKRYLTKELCFWHVMDRMIFRENDES